LTLQKLTEREVLDALRKACVATKLFQWYVGSSFKNKGVQTMLDLVMELMPSPLDKEDTKVQILILVKKLLVNQMLKNHLQH
jgi:elongation factor G